MPLCLIFALSASNFYSVKFCAVVFNLIVLTIGFMALISTDLARSFFVSMKCCLISVCFFQARPVSSLEHTCQSSFAIEVQQHFLYSSRCCGLLALHAAFDQTYGYGKATQNAIWLTFCASLRLSINLIYRVFSRKLCLGQTFCTRSS